jgi:hypothetical protein
MWHTFDTRGRCPGCGKRWRETCCPACARWSPHDDWYHEEPPPEESRDEWVEEGVEEEELVEVR